MTRTVDETFSVFEAVKKSNMVFQLSHQSRQQESHIKARQIVEKNILGKITLMETTTNRNSPEGAWVYDIHEEGSPVPCILTILCALAFLLFFRPRQTVFSSGKQ